jgi:hypothetical protein
LEDLKKERLGLKELVRFLRICRRKSRHGSAIKCACGTMTIKRLNGNKKIDSTGAKTKLNKKLKG